MQVRCTYTTVHDLDVDISFIPRLWLVREVLEIALDGGPDQATDEHLLPFRVTQGVHLLIKCTPALELVIVS